MGLLLYAKGSSEKRKDFGVAPSKCNLIQPLYFIHGILPGIGNRIFLFPPIATQNKHPLWIIPILFFLLYNSSFLQG